MALPPTSTRGSRGSRASPVGLALPLPRRAGGARSVCTEYAHPVAQPGAQRFSAVRALPARLDRTSAPGTDRQDAPERTRKNRPRTRRRAGDRRRPGRPDGGRDAGPCRPANRPRRGDADGRPQAPDGRQVRPEPDHDGAARRPSSAATARRHSTSRRCSRAFGPEAVRDWAEGLGQPTFVGSTGRLFPRAMKASPLLRAWLERLAGLGVTVRTAWRWTGALDPAVFATPGGERSGRVAGRGPRPRRRELAEARLGRRLGACPRRDGRPGRAVPPGERGGRGGLERDDATPHRRPPQGRGVHRSRAAQPRRSRHLAPRPRRRRDLRPDPRPARRRRADPRPRPRPRARRRLRQTGTPPRQGHPLGAPAPRRCTSIRCAWRSCTSSAARCREGAALAALVKSLPVAYTGLRPLDEAISTAGGVRWDGLDAALMLTARPGVFVAGEMIDWEAPTGGYLLTACLATGRWAGLSAAGVPASPRGSDVRSMSAMAGAREAERNVRSASTRSCSAPSSLGAPQAVACRRIRSRRSPQTGGRIRPSAAAGPAGSDAAASRPRKCRPAAMQIETGVVPCASSRRKSGASRATSASAAALTTSSRSASIVAGARSATSSGVSGASSPIL